MPKSSQTTNANRFWDSQISLLAWFATCVSIFSFLFYFQRGNVLLYGDAIAHINIARRVFDSRTPGLLQLGTVWLPLPHLLMIPFLISREMWERGVGGSIPSLAAYVFGVVGIFRLARGSLSRADQADPAANVAAWSAAIVYAANPNLIYMQTTAMGELLYLAFFIWALVFFTQGLHKEQTALTKSALCVAAACLTRYDAWFLAMVMVGVILVLSLHRTQAVESAITVPRSAAVKFVLISAAAPALWLAYNGIIYRNPLEFENGPYSAKVIERKSQSTGNPGHPGSGNLAVAALYFVKSGEANMAENPWLQRLWIALGLAALLIVARSRQTKALVPFFLLLVPLLFYVLSIAYGGVPLFLPQWWPFSYYNVRYGLELLPGFALAFGCLIYFVIRTGKFQSRWKVPLFLVSLAFLIASYASIGHAGPICLREAEVNMRNKNHLEAQLAVWLRKLPQNSTLLMYLGDHVGALQQAGIPLKQVINEGNHRVWKQPIDPEGLWEHALANPAQYADYVVAFEGDPVWQALHDKHLPELIELQVTGQAHAILYRAR